MENERPLVSILMPVYGVEKYIRHCIETLMRQSYHNIEYIIVDDCTKDKSIQIINEVIQAYPNRISQVKIIKHSVNRGLSAARNTALSNSTGTYVMHVDSDDYVDKDIVRLCVEKAIATDADIVTTGRNYVYADKEIVSIPRKYDNLIEWRKSLISGKTHHSVWGNLIKKSLYTNNNITAVEGLHQGEDFAVMPRLAYCAANYEVVQETLYYYLVRTNIYKFSSKTAVDTFNSWKVVKDFYENKTDYELYKNTIEKRLISFLSWQIMSWQMSCPNSNDAELVLRSTYPENFKYNGLALRKKIILYLYVNHLTGLLHMYVKGARWLQLMLNRRSKDVG